MGRGSDIRTQQTDRKDSLMTDTQRNKANLQQLYDRVMNGHDVDAADELITPDRRDHDRTFPPELTRDREGFKILFRMRQLGVGA
jgi:hypothetical protein